MCEYCKSTFIGETNASLTGSDVEINGLKIGFINSFIDDRDGLAEIKTVFSPAFGDRSILSDSMRIHYCPVCGRKLIE